MKRFAIPAITLMMLASAIFAQKSGSPSATTISFYRALKERHYVEGFRHSIYRMAVEGLSTAELQDLEPDFAQTFSAIPDKIEPKGEQITGDTATVFLMFEGVKEPQTVALIRVNGEWLVGDQESLAVIKAQGRAYFFNTRMLVNEDETVEMLQRMIGAEVLYANKFKGRNATFAELVRLGGVPKDMENGESNGYRFTLTLSEDQTTFFVTAVPVAYAKTGRLSFYADLNGLHAQDLKGQPANGLSPVYQMK
ncbi:MAG: hypothetical protein WBV94_32875 [Blastocatellia bacterium]